MITRFPDENDLLRFYKESRRLFAEGGFNLRSLSSKSQKICESAKQEGCLDNDNIVKILGIRWNNKNETILIQNTITNDDQRCTTERDILRESSKIFDLMGMQVQLPFAQNC